MEDGREGDRSFVLMALKMANFQEDDLRRAELQVNCVYIDYDVKASNGGLTPNNCRSTAISSIDGKASVSPRRGSLLAAPLATLLRYLVGAASFLVLDHARLRGDAQQAYLRGPDRKRCC